MDDELFDTSDGWDMSTRREAAVMGMQPRKVPSAYAEDYAAEEDDKRPTFGPAADSLSNVRPPSARNVLSAQEIEALLRPDLSDLPADGDEPDTIADRELNTFRDSNVAQPMMTIEGARRLGARLSLALRRDCGLCAVARIRTLEEMPFVEALGAADPGEALICFSAANDDIAAMLILSPALADALVEAACGGVPSTGKPPIRKLTNLDTAVLSGLLAPAASAITDGASLTQIETEHSFAEALCPPGRAMSLNVEVTIEQLTLPAKLVLSEAILKLLETEPESELLISEDTANRVVTALFTVRLARLSVPLSKLTDLKAGSTLLLGLPPDQPAEILSGGRSGTVVANGDLGRKGNKMALRLSSRVKDPR